MAKKTATAPAKPAVNPDVRPPVILFGIPSRGKIPVAARFAPHEIELARWIAKHEALSLLVADTPVAQQLAAQLRDWQLKAGGSPILGPISASLWENLRALEATGAGASEPAAEAGWVCPASVDINEAFA